MSRRRLVGRRTELGAIAEALDQGARIVVVTGEAGIGKSALVESAVVASGRTNLTANCVPLTEALPLLAFADLLRAAGRVDRGWLDAAIRESPSYVGEVVPLLAPDLAPPTDTTPPLADGWIRARLFSAVMEVLARLHEKRAVLAVIEDLQWADPSSLDLLSLVARSGRDPGVSIIATLRTDDATTDASMIEWMARLQPPSARLIRLDPLGPEETAQLVDAVTGAWPHAARAREIYERSEGNPFYVEQLCRTDPALLLDTVSLGLEGPLGRLSDGGRDLARILAIAGRPLTHADLAELSGLSPASLDSAIRDLRTEYLLDPRLPRSQLRLRHALVADVVAADLPHERRLELHAQVARWLAGSSLPSRDGEIAGHWQRADAPAEEITARSKAATAAHDLQAYAEEAEHRLRVVDLWNQVADPGQLTGTDRITAVVDADWALFDSGQGERDAALLTRELSNLPEAAVRDRAMLLRRLARVTAWIDAPKATELMLSAAALFEEAPGGLDHILMLADLTDLRRSQGRFDEAMRLADRALAACRDEPELGLERSVAARRALCLAFAGDADATATALHALSSATAATVREQVVAALRQTEALIRIGRPSEAHEAAADLLAAADRYGATGARLVNLLRSLVGRAELAAGRVDSARRLATSAARDAPAEDEGLLDLLSATLAIVDGDLIEAERLVTADVTTTTAWPADVLDAAKVLAEVHLWAGRPESAAEVLESVLDTVSGSDLASIAGPALVSLARAHADLAAARATTRRTEPVAVRTSMKIDPLTDAVSAAFWEAETARATDATSHAAWEHAADLAERSALRFDAAYACWRQAEALLHQHQRSEATASLRRAHQLAEAHQPLTAAIERTALAGRVDLTPERGQPGVVEQARPFGITDREMTVLTELAFGKSNPEIGASLYLSPKTVSVHISSLMRKLQARSRTEAVAVAQRAGLLS